MNVCIIIAVEHDLHADAIVDQLVNVAIVIRFDPFKPLPKLKFCYGSDEIQLGQHKFRLDDVTGIFCRVALEAINFGHLDDPLQKFSAHEHLSAIVGVLLTVPSTKWINFPWNESRAEGKIYPMVMASNVGVKVPKFVASSKMDDLREFAFLEGSCIIKPLSDMSIARQRGRFVEVPEMADFDAPYTTDFKLDQFADFSYDEETPTLVQNKIQKGADIRMVVIDNISFCSRLCVDQVNVDSRLTKKRNEAMIKINADLENRLLYLVRNKLSLRFAAIDLIEEAGGDIYLVDVNPSGNWLWQERSLDMPISKTIAKSLLPKSDPVADSKCA